MLNVNKDAALVIALRTDKQKKMKLEEVWG